jgi:predicted ribosome quality control (RQC) complex YloA/Tae2 family protein
MLNFIIKTHRKGTIYAKPHLFILNKGMNSGKPQREPFTNSFVIIFQNEEDCENLFWIAFSLWKSKFWHQHLIGSVIPFLRLSDFKNEFTPKSNVLMQEHEEHKKNVAALKLLEQKEAQFHQNINLINDIRRVIVYRYCK